MTSRIGWIDFSQEHRNRVFSVIDMLGSSGTVDELGIGVIRDAMADWLFPGISTIQTRPKYFLLIPKLIQNYVALYKSGAKVPKLSDWLKDKEHELMHKLAAYYSYKDNNGVIGINVASRNGELARRASSIYWNGIRTQGIVETDYSLNDYLVRNDLSTVVRGKKDDEEKDDPDQLTELDEFGFKMPAFDSLDNNLQLELSAEEARYLKDQFRSDHWRKRPENLLKQLVLIPEFAVHAREAASFPVFAGLLLADSRLPSQTASLLQLALDFSNLIHGAHIRYNICLHAQAGTGKFDAEWTAWLEDLQLKKGHYANFQLDFLLNTIAPQAKSYTKKFLRNWHSAVTQLEPDTALLDKLVRNQEINNKGEKAKLTSRSAEYRNWVGIEHIHYRFQQVKNIFIDLENSLGHD